MSSFRGSPLVFVTLAFLLAGCASDSARQGTPKELAPGSAAQDEKDHSGGMHPYVPSPSDPVWLAKASEFHGHLGPWSTIGAILGRDAVARLGNPSAWDVRVICWTPPAKRTPPFSCVMDGLQCGSGASLGKRNIRFAWDSQRNADGRPEVWIAHAGPDGRVQKGLSYCVSEKTLDGLKEAVVTKTLERYSRRLAATNLEDLFDVRPLTSAEIESVGVIVRSETGD